MKVRQGFVSNSSSSSFYITNKTDKLLTVVDLAKETIHLVKEYMTEYGDSSPAKLDWVPGHGSERWDFKKFPLNEHEQAYIDAAEVRLDKLWDRGTEEIAKEIVRAPRWNDDEDCCYETLFPAKSKVIAMFGDEDGDAVGRVLDYMLRDSGETKSFKWSFHEHQR